MRKHIKIGRLLIFINIRWIRKGSRINYNLKTWRKQFEEAIAKEKELEAKGLLKQENELDW